MTARCSNHSSRSSARARIWSSRIMPSCWRSCCRTDVGSSSCGSDSKLSPHFRKRHGLRLLAAFVEERHQALVLSRPRDLLVEIVLLDRGQQKLASVRELHDEVFVASL